VEPLRALITSQIADLTRRGLNVVRLLTRDETSSGGMHGTDFLRHLLTVNKKDLIDKPLIIFATPELLSCCMEENGPVHALIKKSIISLVVIDEFDSIYDSHEQYRKAYTTIVPDLKILAQDCNIPFLYLSATGSCDKIYEVLTVNSNVNPILFQSAHILPLHHVYKGMYITNNSHSFTQFRKSI
jgi:superfamily II DNA helicase RecQ